MHPNDQISDALEVRMSNKTSGGRKNVVIPGKPDGGCLAKKD